MKSFTQGQAAGGLLAITLLLRIFDYINYTSIPIDTSELFTPEGILFMIFGFGGLVSEASLLMYALLFIASLVVIVTSFKHKSKNIGYAWIALVLSGAPIFSLLPWFLGGSF